MAIKYIYELDGNYLQTFVSLSKRDWSQFKGLKTGRLTPGELCNCLATSSGACNNLNLWATNLNEQAITSYS